MATAAGVGFVAFPWIALAAAALWVVLAAATRKASLASLVAITLVPVAAAVTGQPGGEIAASAAISALVVLRHRDNFGRLLRGRGALAG